MSYRQLREKYNEGPEDHFDLDEYIQYLERTDQRHEVNLIRRQLRREEENER